MKPFKYKKISRAERLPVTPIQIPPEISTEYTGEIDGMSATEGEENCLKAAYQTGQIINHEFKMPVGAPRGYPGQKELDFLFTGKTGVFWAIQVRDYDFIHKGFENEGKDARTDILILQMLKEEGIFPQGDTIMTISDDDLATPEEAKYTMEAMLV